jgi:catechol 2,3-dioxygenase-like lactoylglutathione lyase family enzyme
VLKLQNNKYRGVAILNLRRILAGMSGIGLFASLALAQTVPPLADDVRPIRVSGLGIKVSDLERSKNFYTEVLGLKIGAKVPARGEAVEYLLGMTGDIRADTLIVIRKGEVKPGATDFGTITIVVPSGRKMAERVVAAGYTTARPIVDGTNFVKDPDGYTVELYQRPAARAPQ